MKKIKIDLEPKVFANYEEMLDRGISLNNIFPVLEDFNIIGYKIMSISDIEEEYRWLCKELFDKGIDTEVQITNKFNYPYWFAIEIVERQKEIGLENLMSNCFYFK